MKLIILFLIINSLCLILDNIVSSKMDSVTSALIQDPELLLTVIDSSVAEDLINRYPALCVLLKMILSNVTVDPSARIFQEEDDEEDISGIDPALLAQAELFAINEEDIRQEQQQQQQQADSRNQISASDLANALSVATMNPNERQEAASDEEDLNVALEQMQTMGITNEELSRRALRMSRGDVEVALNLIFEGTLV